MENGTVLKVFNDCSFMSARYFFKETCKVSCGSGYSPALSLMLWLTQCNKVLLTPFTLSIIQFFSISLSIIQFFSISQDVFQTP